MPDVSVPSRYRNGLKMLVGLTEAQLSELLAALGRCEPKVQRAAFLKQLQGMTPTIERNNLRDILDALLALPTVRDSYEQTDAVFAEGLARSDDLAIDPAQRQRFVEAIVAVLGVPPVVLTSKAGDIYGDHQRMLAGTRILTDIRPVFAGAPSQGPDAALILHTLKIHYFQGTQHQDVYLAMDRIDLDRLKDVIRRAEEKADQLKNVLAKENIRLMDVEEI